MSLAISGLLALIIAISRFPYINLLFQNPLILKKFLIIHVNLALIIWIHTFILAMFFLLPTKIYKFAKKHNPLIRIFILLMKTNIIFMISTIYIKSATPILSNYIPILHHPIYLINIIAFAISIMLSYYTTKRLYINIDTHIIPNYIIFGLKIIALSFTVFIFSICISLIYTNIHMPHNIYYEYLFWAPGHILQIISQMGMITAWMIISHNIFKIKQLNYNLIKIIFIFLFISCIINMCLPYFNTTSYLSYIGSTFIMKFHIIIIMTLFLYNFISKLIQIDASYIKTSYFQGIMMSILLTLLGYILGFFITNQNTIIPAHYHATIGGVTTSFMTLSLLLYKIYYPNLSKTMHKHINITLQPLIFGTGQILFAIGFALAGIYDAPRKTFGIDQLLTNPEAYFGLIIMSLGGIIATIGGLLFIYQFYIIYKNKTLFINHENIS